MSSSPLPDCGRWAANCVSGPTACVRYNLRNFSRPLESLNSVIGNAIGSESIISMLGSLMKATEVCVRVAEKD